MNSQSLAITKLTAAGYQVWFPLSSKSVLIICKDSDNTFLERCFVSKASPDRDRCPVGRIPTSGLSVDADYLLFADTDNLRCWLIPRADVCAFNSIRIGRRYDTYELAGKKKFRTKKDDDIKKGAEELVAALSKGSSVQL